MKRTGKLKKNRNYHLGGGTAEQPTGRTKGGRLRSQKHLAKVRELPCVICGWIPSDPHHLRSVGHQRGASIKNGDDFTIPLCRKHHEELHMFGSEKLFLDLHGIDAKLILAQMKEGKHE